MRESYANNAHSLDGLEFFFEAELSSHISTGDFVILKKAEDSAKKYLGIIEQAEIESVRFPRGVDDGVMRSPLFPSSTVIRTEGIKGYGKILGILNSKKFQPSSREDSFDHFNISYASKDEIESWSTFISQKDDFSIGKFLISQDISVPLYPDNLSRHTFLSGQTGSGKSSAIRTTLIRILEMKDKPKIVVFDLNSEYKDLWKKAKDGKEHKGINLSMKMSKKDGYELIQIDFFQMEDDLKLSIIDIDPIKDPFVFFHFRRGLSSYFDNIKVRGHSCNVEGLVSFLHTGNYEYSKESGYSFNNIDISRWDIWKTEKTKILLNEVFFSDYEIVNIDLGSVKNKTQKLTIASFILEYLWNNRENKQNFLLVIDEAHNIIPNFPSNLLSNNIADRLIDIAGEGRKYGLYLLLCSQQPSKIHENVLSLCNNLILLQTTSTLDLDFIYSKFSNIPKSFIKKARFLKKGEAIIGGPLVKTPIFIKLDYLK